MAKKGKVFEFAGLRFQIDPLILVRRVVTRQIPVMLVIAVLGGVATAVAYLKAEKKYTSTAKVQVRKDRLEEIELNKQLEVAGVYMSTDAEMMLIVNELDLFPAKRQPGRPYEVPITNLRDALGVNAGDNQIVVSFTSPDPKEAKRIVEFTMERMLNKMASLDETPYTKEIESIDRALSLIVPKKRQAEDRKFAFQAKHPSIAVEGGGLILGDSSPLGSIDRAIEQARQDLRDARHGRVGRRRTVRNTPATAELARRDKRYRELLKLYTPSHPSVIAAKRERDTQKKKVDIENAKANGAIDPNQSPEKQRKARIATAEAQLARMIAKRRDATKNLRGVPRKKAEWAEIQQNVTALTTEYSQLLNRKNEVQRDRLLAASNFQENFQLVDPAKIPNIPTEPKKGKFLGIGIGLTAAIGILLAVGREGFRQTFVSAKELEEATGMQVVAVLPNISNFGKEGTS